MSKRKLGGNYVLPDNPEWIVFPRSDGDAKVLPKNTQRIVDSQGEVNFMRPISLEESSSVMWRVSVGSQVAIKLNYPGALSRSAHMLRSLTFAQEGPNYVLKEWPQGYQFFDHNKGPAGSPRHDVYLCGMSFVSLQCRSLNCLRVYSRKSLPFCQ